MFDRGGFFFFSLSFSQPSGGDVGRSPVELKVGKQKLNAVLGWMQDLPGQWSKVRG